MGVAGNDGEESAPRARSSCPPDRRVLARISSPTEISCLRVYAPSCARAATTADSADPASLRDRTCAPERTDAPSPYPDLPRHRRRNHRTAALVEQRDGLFGLADERINARTLPVEERGDRLLLGQWGEGDEYIFHV